MTDSTTYRATIPTHHDSTHRSERAALRAIRTAERARGVAGEVNMIVTSGTYRSVTRVYGYFGVGQQLGNTVAR